MILHGGDSVYLEQLPNLNGICTSNHMLGKAIWDKLPECIFENFQIFQKSRG